MEGINFKR